MECLQSSRAENEQVVPGLIESILDSKNRLDKDRSSMESLEAQARALPPELQLATPALNRFGPAGRVLELMTCNFNSR
jgi:hypothetical protein